MTTLPTSHSWFPYSHHGQRKQAQVRLFCFHHAGGSASVFRPWQSSAFNNIEIWPVQLPGRENRFREAPLTDLAVLIPQLKEAILPSLDRPFAFFGHSMGVMLCFELARMLRKHHQLEPKHLFFSAFAEFQQPRPAPFYHLPEEQFIAVFQQRFEGFSPEVLASRELLDLCVPILRADFTLVQTYRYTPDEPFSCPITALGGSQDKVVNPDSLAAWQQHTKGRFLLRMFPGKHLFIQTAQESLLAYVSQALANDF